MRFRWIGWLGGGILLWLSALAVSAELPSGRMDAMSRDVDSPPSSADGETVTMSNSGGTTQFLPAARPDWAIVLHGGAGTISRDQPQQSIQAHRAALKDALQRGCRILDQSGSSLDAVEQVLRVLEDHPLFNAGRGAVFTHEGTHELDASVMDGRTLACGAVANVTTAKHPISLARLVMERTRHVLLAGPGADRFAVEMGIDVVPNEYFSTDHRRQQLDEAQQRQREQQQVDPLKDSAARSADQRYGTVGCVALDRHGNLAAGTSTGGLTNKRAGRIGDSPIIGAGTYANNATCGVSATGIGEEFIRHAVAFQISALIEHGGKSLEEAAELVLEQRLPARAGGIIALDGAGNVVCRYTTDGMYRAWARSDGRQEVKIWE